MIGSYLKCSVRSDTRAELCCRRWGVKEGIQTSGLFESISGSLMTNKGNTTGRAYWESGDSSIFCVGNVVSSLGASADG